MTTIADLKLVLLGESSVGKSSFVTRFQNDTFNPDRQSTIGAAFITRKVPIVHNREERIVNLQIWDTAGQERYRSLTPMYYRNANVALVLFDLTDVSSFDKAKYWINELTTYIRDHGLDDNMATSIMLIGNKLDLVEGECEFIDQVKDLLVSNPYKYFETSCKSGTNVHEVFEHVVQNVDESLFKSVESESDDRVQLNSSHSQNCQC